MSLISSIRFLRIFHSGEVFGLGGLYIGKIGVKIRVLVQGNGNVLEVGAKNAHYSYNVTCNTTAVDDKARPFPMTIAAGPVCPQTKRATKPTTTAVTKTCICYAY